MKIYSTLLILFVCSLSFAQKNEAQVQQMLKEKFSKKEIKQLKSNSSDFYYTTESLKHSYCVEMNEKNINEFEKITVENFNASKTPNFLLFGITVKEEDQYFRINDTKYMLHVRGTSYIDYLKKQADEK